MRKGNGKEKERNKVFIYIFFISLIMHHPVAVVFPLWQASVCPINTYLYLLDETISQLYTIEKYMWKTKEQEW